MLYNTMKLFYSQIRKKKYLLTILSQYDILYYDIHPVLDQDMA